MEEEEVEEVRTASTASTCLLTPYTDCLKVRVAERIGSVKEERERGREREGGREREEERGEERVRERERGGERGREGREKGREGRERGRGRGRGRERGEGRERGREGEVWYYIQLNFLLNLKLTFRREQSRYLTGPYIIITGHSHYISATFSEGKRFRGISTNRIKQWSTTMSTGMRYYPIICSVRLMEDQVMHKFKYYQVSFVLTIIMYMYIPV